MKALTTHSVYPEINIDPNHIFTVKLIDEKGNVKFEDIGAGKTNVEARAKARAMVEKELLNFAKGE